MTKLVNHIIFCIDGSGSMSGHMRAVAEVFEQTMKTIREGQVGGQDNNISVYQFDSNIECMAMNVPVSAMHTPKFWCRGTTALRDAAKRAIEDHKKFKNVKGEDHTFLMYVITDGQDNASRTSPQELSGLFSDMSEDWTLVAMVPSVADSHYAKMSGFPAGNIQIWDVKSERGFEDVGRAVAASYQTYGAMRTNGVRSSSSIFSADLSNVSTNAVKQAGLTEVKGNLFHAQKDYVIKDMVEKFTGKPYVKGSAFYELTKTETIQGYKEIVIIRNNKEAKRYGGSEARNLLGVGSNDMKIKPGDHGDWRIFIQSTSLNRKVLAGTSIFVKE